jgi:hypothetical protein
MADGGISMAVDKICGDSANLNKKPRVAGLFIYSIMTEGGRGSAARRLVSNRLKLRLMPPILPQYLRSHLLASPAPNGNSKFPLQAPQVLNTRLRSLANLFVGDSIADTYIHALIQNQMRMIVNSITHKPRCRFC